MYSMNFGNILNALLSKTGMPDSANQRYNYRLQDYMDAINSVYNEILRNCHPTHYPIIRERALVVGPGTSAPDLDADLGYPVGAPPGGYLTAGARAAPDGYNGEYHLNSWVHTPLEFWTEGPTAHRVVLRRYRNANMEGLRNSNFAPVSLGPYTLSWIPRSTNAFYDFGSGAAVGASAVDDGTNVTVTFGATSNALGATVVGMLLQLNGEDADYRIVTQDGAHSCTVDRPIRSRMDGLMTTNGRGAGYSNVRWMIRPRGCYKIRLLPAPSASANLYYSSFDLPRRLINNDDTPELGPLDHDLLWKGALRIVAAEKMQDGMYQMWDKEFKEALASVRKATRDEAASEDGPNFETLDDIANAVTPYAPGVYNRNYARGW